MSIKDIAVGEELMCGIDSNKTLDLCESSKGYFIFRILQNYGSFLIRWRWGFVSSIRRIEFECILTAYFLSFRGIGRFVMDVVKKDNFVNRPVSSLRVERQ